MLRDGERVALIFSIGFALSARAALAGPSQCERLFHEQEEIATCDSLVGLYGPRPDDELRERVSRQVHGMSYEQAEAKRAKEEEEAQKHRAAFERTKNDDRCGQLFDIDEQRDLCRWKGIFLSSYRSDEELRKEVSLEMQHMAKDPEYREHILRQLSELSGNGEYAQQLKAIEEKRRIQAKAEEKRRAGELRSKLTDRPVGFALRGWELGGFDNVLVASFWLQNNTKQITRDFLITCRLYGESGTSLGTANAVLYSALEAGKRRSFKLNMGLVHSQSAKAACDLSNWK